MYTYIHIYRYTSMDIHKNRPPIRKTHLQSIYAHVCIHIHTHTQMYTYI